MRLFVYSYRMFDEAEYFTKFSEEYGVELGICTDAPTLENAYLAEGYEYISIITTKIDRDLMKRFAEMGVKMISTRTVGYDHVDLDAAREFGIRGQQCVLLAGVRGGLYDHADADVHPQDEADHAEGGDQ